MHFPDEGFQYSNRNRSKATPRGCHRGIPRHPLLARDVNHYGRGPILYQEICSRVLKIRLISRYLILWSIIKSILLYFSCVYQFTTRRPSNMSSSTQYTPLFETTTFHSPDGIDIILELWRNNESGRECIQCDICYGFFLVNERRYPITFGKHRNNATCQKAKEKHKRKQVVASATATAKFMAETLFHSRRLLIAEALCALTCH